MSDVRKHLRPVIRTSAPLLAALMALGMACGRRLEAPPIEVLKRPSLLGAGTIIQLKSTTNEELTEIEVSISSAQREFTYVEPRLGAYETVEIGWKKLGGWQVPDDARVEVRASGYLLPVRAELGPANDQATESGADGG